MVRIGKLFATKNRGDDDASLLSNKFGSMKFGKSKKPPPLDPLRVEVIATKTVTDPVLTEDISSRRTSGKNKTTSNQSGVVLAPSTISEGNEDETREEEERGEEERDEVVSSANTPLPTDPLRERVGVTNEKQRAPSGFADEQSFEETVPSCAGTGDETYEEEEEEECSEEGTLDENEKSFDSAAELNDAAMQHEQENTTAFSEPRSVGIAKGNEMSKKYFHKDVVLNSLEDGANSLVIRAMYFIPRPKAVDHVVVKIEVSFGLLDDQHVFWRDGTQKKMHTSYMLHSFSHRHPPYPPVIV